MLRFLLPISLFLLCACPPGLTHFEDSNVGQACFDIDLGADQPLVVTITATCFSGSTQNLELSCEVVVEGTTITVTSTADYDLPPVSTTDCQIVETECSSDPLPAGTYTVEYGNGSSNLDVPGPMPKAPEVCLEP